MIGLEDNRAVWTGGNTTLVQMGDILDRGDEEIGAREQVQGPLRPHWRSRPPQASSFCCNGWLRVRRRRAALCTC